MIYINRFLDNIKIHESSNTQKIIMSVNEAKGLHTDITKLLLALYELKTKPSDEIMHEIEIKNEDW